MKRVLLFLLLGLPSVAFAQVVLQGSSYAENASVQATPTAAGWDLIVEVIGAGGTSASPTVTDSYTATSVPADFAYSYDSASTVGIGIYRVHDAASGVVHKFTVTWGTAPSAYYMVLYAVSNVSGVDTGAGTVALATGSTSPATTGSLTPSGSGDLVIASMGVNHGETLGTWTGGFSTDQSDGPGPSFAVGHLITGTTASSSISLSSAVAWGALLIAYKPVTVAACPCQGLIGVN